MRARLQLPVVVVGAGSAGVVVASQLAKDPSTRVLLIDNGNQLGGSSLVNYMVGMWGMRGDYDWQQKFGCVGWNWKNAEKTFSAMPDPLHNVSMGDAGQVDKAILAAASARGVPVVGNVFQNFEIGQGVGWTALTMQNGKRHSVVETYLPQRTVRSNLEIRLNTEVDSVIMNGRHAAGVRLADGEEIESRCVVLCGGALVTPVLLRRSGINREGIGKGLKNHPSVVLSLELKEASQTQICIGAGLRASSSFGIGDINMLSMNFTEENLLYGALIGGVMSVSSRGSVEYDPTTRLGSAHYHSLTSEQDVVVMRETVRLLQSYAQSSEVREISHNSFSDHVGTTSVWLSDASDDAIDLWARQQPGVYAHPACTCAMGDSRNEMAVVDVRGQVIGYEDLVVCDASVLPDLPRANTHLPVVMVANRIGTALRERLATQN